MAFFGNKRKDFSIQPPKQQVDGTPFFVTDSANIDFTLANLNLTANLTQLLPTSGTYGDATHIPILQIDQFGRITGVTTTTFSASGITLQTNSVTNPTQTILNLIQGTNMTITDDGLGNITFNASGTGGPTAWGSITGTLTSQTDLITYLTTNYYPLTGNPSGFLTTISGLNISLLTNDSGYITSAALTGYVPYTGATTNVNLGAFDLTATKLIKNGGASTQFLKADGTVDNNVYLTSADLPSTLSLFATTTADPIILGYSVLVRNILDPRYDDPAVNVPIGPITTTGQLLSSLVSDANVISGDPGTFNITTVGNIRRTSGTGQANFYFEVYQRTSGGVETLVTTSNTTVAVSSATYVEFTATALWSNGLFLSTDRIVLKFYANRIPTGSNPSYQFQFGGALPVRTLAAIPVSVLPNIYLSNLVDVEDIPALPNEVLYWNNTANLWEHSLVNDLVVATNSVQNISNVIQLVNDNAAPGNDKVYGTSPTGVKGWQNAATGGGITELTGDVTTPAASSGVTAATLKANLKIGSFGVTVDGVTSIVQVGKVGYVTIPYAGTITGWSITANAAGNIQFDIWKAAGAIPTTTIVSDSTYPALVADDFDTSTTVGGWVTTFAAGDVFGFQVIGTPSVIKNATLTIRCTKS